MVPVEQINMPKIIRVGLVGLVIAGALTLLASLAFPAHANAIWWGPIVNRLILFGLLGAIGGILFERYVIQRRRQGRREERHAGGPNDR